MNSRTSTKTPSGLQPKSSTQKSVFSQKQGPENEEKCHVLRYIMICTQIGNKTNYHMYISSHILHFVPLMQKLEKFISGFTKGNISPLLCKHTQRTTVYYFRGARGRYSTRQEQGQAGSSLCMCESVSEKSAWVYFVVIRFVLQLSTHKSSAGLSETLVSTQKGFGLDSE